MKVTPQPGSQSHAQQQLHLPYWRMLLQHLNEVAPRVAGEVGSNGFRHARHHNLPTLIGPF
jgi:hypothetical protein